MTDTPATDAAPESKDVESKDTERRELPLPTDLKALLLLGIFCMMAFYALYLTGEIVVPIIIAFLIKMVLQPGMELLVDWHVPRFIAALLLLVALLGVVSGLAFALAAPAASWLSNAPQGVVRLEKRLKAVSEMTHNLRQASQDVEKISEDSAGPPAVAVKGPPLSTFLFSGTRALVAGLLTVVVLLFFLLVSGNSFLRRIVEILPRLRDKKQAVEIIYEIQRTVSTYLGTVTAMNAAVGLLTGLATYFCGLGDPLLWGAVAFALNYIPILGPVVNMAVLALAGLLTFDPLWQALLPAGIYLLIHLVEGEAITPTLLARQLTLNPVVVIIALVFWYWMWGVAGALLAVPMLATFKIVCDRVQSLAAIGHFLGSEAREMQVSV
jgi:predicted PurR-regulated permease PerM